MGVPSFTCALCGSRWSNWRGKRTKFCSAACRQRAKRRRYQFRNREPQTCPSCRSIWVNWRGSMRVCSDDCRRNIKAERRREQRARVRLRRRAEALARPCPDCDRSINLDLRSGRCAECQADRPPRKQRPPQTCVLCGVAWCWLDPPSGYKTAVCPDCGEVKSGYPSKRTCAMCGDSFAASWFNTRFCTSKCAKSAHRGMRRAQRKATAVEPYSRLSIFVRDKWVCQICERKVDRSMSGQHPEGPTIDHIVPLSLGGTDSPVNVQLAHRSCNVAKGVRAVGSQLRLVG